MNNKNSKPTKPQEKNLPPAAQTVLAGQHTEDQNQLSKKVPHFNDLRNKAQKNKLEIRINDLEDKKLAPPAREDINPTQKPSTSNDWQPIIRF